MTASSVTQMIAKFRRITFLRGGETELPLRMTHQESAAVAQVESPGFELARSGRRFMLGNNAAITGITTVTALPTTTAQFALWNPDPVRTYFFESLGVFLSGGTPAATGILLLAALFRAPAQLGASLTGVNVISQSGSSQGSRAILKTAVTITDPTAPIWYPIAQVGSAIAAAFPNAIPLEHRTLGGRLAVPPGWGLGINGVTTAGTAALFVPFAEWTEIETDME